MSAGSDIFDLMLGITDSSDACSNESTIEQVKIVQLERVEHPWTEDGKNLTQN